MDDQPVDYSRKWYVLAAVGMGIFLSTIDGSIVNNALPYLETAFDSEFAVVQWVVLAYLLVISSLMLGVGRINPAEVRSEVVDMGLDSGARFIGAALYWIFVNSVISKDILMILKIPKRKSKILKMK